MKNSEKIEFYSKEQERIENNIFKWKILKIFFDNYELDIEDIEQIILAELGLESNNYLIWKEKSIKGEDILCAVSYKSKINNRFSIRISAIKFPNAYRIAMDSANKKVKSLEKPKQKLEFINDFLNTINNLNYGKN